MSNHIRDDMTLTIYYFPDNVNNPTAENLIMQDGLKELIFLELDGLLPLRDNFALEIIGYASAVVDDVLQFKIDITMNHKIIKHEHAKLMEELQVRYNDSEIIREDD